jgi:soluble lytic murein transglycosylase-like protein
MSPLCRLTAVSTALLLAGAASADPEIERKLARLRALTRGAVARPEPSPLPPRGCSPARAERHDRAGAVVARLRAIQDASLRYAVSADLIRSVIRHESAGNPAAVSHKGAMGLMQLMPATARALGVGCAFDPRQNILGGTRYLRELRDRFGSWGRAIAAYNAGPARVESGRLPQETRRYVENVLRTWRGI